MQDSRGDRLNEQTPSSGFAGPLQFLAPVSHRRADDGFFHRVRLTEALRDPNAQHVQLQESPVNSGADGNNSKRNGHDVNNALGCAELQKKSSYP